MPNQTYTTEQLKAMGYVPDGQGGMVHSSASPQQPPAAPSQQASPQPDAAPQPNAPPTYTTEQLQGMGYSPDGQGGMVHSQQRQPPPQPTQRTDAAPHPEGGLMSDLGKRASAIGEDWSRTSHGQQNPVRTAVRTVGNVIGGGMDVIGKAVSAVTPDFIGKPVSEAAGAVMNSAPVKAVTDAYGNWATAHPEAAKDAAAIGNIASILPFGEGKAVAEEVLAKPLAAGRMAKAKNLMEEVIRPSKGEISKIEIKRGRDINEIAGAITQHKIEPKIVDGKMEFHDGIDTMKKQVASDAPRVKAMLEKTPGHVDLAKVGATVEKDLAKTFKNAEDFADAKKTVDELLISEAERHGAVKVPLSTANEIKSGFWSVGYDATKPMRNKIARRIGHAIDDAINAQAPKLVSRLNHNMSLAYDAISLMENATGRVMKGGRLGQYFGGMVGSGMAGSLNPLLAPLGYGVGKSVTEGMAARGTVGAARKAGRLMEKAVYGGAQAPMLLMQDAKSGLKAAAKDVAEKAPSGLLLRRRAAMAAKAAGKGRP